MENRTLVVSSWNTEIFEVSGKLLLDNFQNGRLERPCNDYRYWTDDFFQYHVLYQNWFKEYRNIIPTHFGGSAKPCKCRKPLSKADNDHIKGCRYTWWNRNVFRWIKKVFVIADAFEDCRYTRHDRILWLDADCILLKQITTNFLDFVYRDSDIFFFKGDREVSECGIVGYRICDETYSFIQRFVDMYINGEFLKLVRWDDSYVFDKIRSRFPFQNLNYLDWAGPTGEWGDVVGTSLLRGYIIHNKGTHGRIKGIYQ